MVREAEADNAEADRKVAARIATPQAAQRVISGAPPAEPQGLTIEHAINMIDQLEHGIANGNDDALSLLPRLFGILDAWLVLTRLR